MLLDLVGYAGIGRLAHLTRLSDEAILAVVLDRGPTSDCWLPYFGASAPLLFAMFDGKNIRYGRAPTDIGTGIVWHETSLPFTGGYERFIFDGGYGFGSGAGPLLAKSPSATSHAELGGGGERVHGFGDQLVWTNATSNAIRSYTVGTGAIDLLAMPADRHPFSVRLSTDRMVWVSGKLVGSSYEDVRWHSSPRATSANAIAVNDGPSLPITTGLMDLQINGDWAALNACTGKNDPNLCRVYIWHIATGKTWVLPPRPGKRFTRVLAVGQTEIVLGETGFASEDSQFLRTIVRIDLGSLDSIVAAWTK